MTKGLKYEHNMTIMYFLVLIVTQVSLMDT